MRKKQDGDTWFFIDESGDTEFYNSKGELVSDKKNWNAIFLLGFIETQDPSSLRAALRTLSVEIDADPAYRHIYSLPQSIQGFHAAKDHPRIRERVFALLPQLEFRAEFVLVRKQGLIKEFHERFDGNANKMYDQMTSMLFGNVLHRYQTNHIHYAVRRQRPRQIHFHNAILFAISEFEKKQNRKIGCSFNVHAQRPNHEPCLSVIDYMNWAVQRAFVHGELKYYRMVENKVSLLLDRYHPSDPNGRIFYSRKNPLREDLLEPVKNRAQVASFK